MLRFLSIYIQSVDKYFDNKLKIDFAKQNFIGGYKEKLKEEWPT